MPSPAPPQRPKPKPRGGAKTVVIPAPQPQPVPAVGVPVPAAPTPLAQARLPVGIEVGHYLLGALAPIVLLFLFVAAHTAMDQSSPDESTAKADLMMVVGIGVPVLLGATLIALRGNPASLWAGLGGIPIAFWLQNLGTTWGGQYCGRAGSFGFWWSHTYTEATCNPAALIGWNVILIGFAALAGGGIAALVFFTQDRPREAAAWMLGAGLTLVVGAVVAAILLLPQLQDEAAKAASSNSIQYHSTPGVGLLLCVVALLGWAAWRRRSPV